MSPGEKIEILAPNGDVHRVELMSISQAHGYAIVIDGLSTFVASRYRAIGETEWRERRKHDAKNKNS